MGSCALFDIFLGSVRVVAVVVVVVSHFSLSFMLCVCAPFSHMTHSTIWNRWEFHSIFFFLVNRSRKIFVSPDRWCVIVYLLAPVSFDSQSITSFFLLPDSILWKYGSWFELRVSAYTEHYTYTPIHLGSTNNNVNAHWTERVEKKREWMCRLIGKIENWLFKLSERVVKMIWFRNKTKPPKSSNTQFTIHNPHTQYTHPTNIHHPHKTYV